MDRLVFGVLLVDPAEGIEQRQQHLGMGALGRQWVLDIEDWVAGLRQEQQVSGEHLLCAADPATTMDIYDRGKLGCSRVRRNDFQALVGVGTIGVLGDLARRGQSLEAVEDTCDALQRAPSHDSKSLPEPQGCRCAGPSHHRQEKMEVASDLLYILATVRTLRCRTSLPGTAVLSRMLIVFSCFLLGFSKKQKKTFQLLTR